MSSLKEENNILGKEKQSQKSAQADIQSQLQSLKSKEYLVLGSFIIASGIGRVLMQGVPSVEPIIFFAVLAGWLFGSKKGFAVGSSSLFLSNFFVMGGQGPWTVFQMLAFGIAGALGGLLRKKAKLVEGFLVMILATIIFEVIVDVGSAIYNPQSIFSVFLLGLPFMAIHLVSNGIFSMALPKAKQFVESTGRFDEKELYLRFLAKLRRKKNEN